MWKVGSSSPASARRQVFRTMPAIRAFHLLEGRLEVLRAEMDRELAELFGCSPER